MKIITLIKICKEIQLAHLYEHLYCRALIKFLKEQELINYIDYFWEGKTYYGGIVHLEVQLLSPRAEKADPQLSKLTIALDDNSIRTALAELTAEKKVHMGERVKQTDTLLKELHAQSWQRLDDVLNIDTRQLRRSRRAVWLTDSPARIGTLKSILVLSDNLTAHRELLPLFIVLADAIQDNLHTNVFSLKGHYYADEDSLMCKGKAAMSTTKFRAWKTFIPHLTNELEACQAEIARLLELDLLDRFIHMLQISSYENFPYGPNEHRIYKATEILMGAAGWRAIATEENVLEVLRHTTLRLTFGREQQSFMLRELLAVQEKTTTRK